MSSAVATISTEDAEAEVAELRAEIADKEAWLVAAPVLIEEAALEEARKGTKASSRFSCTKSLQKRKVDTEAELPRLRGQLRMYEEVLAERALVEADLRRAEIEAQAGKYDDDET